MSCQKFNEHKASAKKRGIAFALTYEQWLEVWGDKLPNRGRGSNQYGMLRTRDEGGYELGNVRIGTPKENHQEKAVVAFVKRAPRKPVDVLCPYPVRTSWIEGRNKVFLEYSEENEEND